LGSSEGERGVWHGPVIALTSIAYLMRRRVRVGDENQLAYACIGTQTATAAGKKTKERMEESTMGMPGHSRAKCMHL
jgi:hypothetical protein